MSHLIEGEPQYPPQVPRTRTHERHGMGSSAPRQPEQEPTIRYDDDRHTVWIGESEVRLIPDPPPLEREIDLST